MGSASSFSFGNGLVETAAVTTIIGATTAESLILGSRGAAGLPWAVMSSFGSLHVVKCCLTACIPETFRDSLGLRTAECDHILGTHTWSKPLSSREPVGVVSRLSMKHCAAGKKALQREIGFVYKFDEYTNNIVNSCPAVRKAGSPDIFRFCSGEPQRAEAVKQTAPHWLGIAASLVKCGEFTILLLQDSALLAVSSTVTWLFFLLAAISLQALGLSRQYSPSNVDRNTDILVGSLPTIQKHSSDLKIVLGVPMNVRTHMAWRVVWFLGCLVSCVSLFSTCFILSDQTLEVFYIWVAFQVLWLLLRTMFFHFTHKIDEIQHPTLRCAPPYPGPRLLNLARGVSQYKALRHPRGVSSYARDEQDAAKIAEQIISSAWLPVPQIANTESIKHIRSCPDPEKLRELGTVNIEYVIGDTMLSAFAWVHNLNLDDMDMFDCCLVAFSVQGKRYLIPSARVVSGNISQVRASSGDPEAHVANVPGLVPRLGPNERGDNGWVFWVPLEPDKWLHMISSMDFLGEQQVEILDDAEVTRRLNLGTLGVSLAHVDEVKGILRNSATVGQVMIDSLLGE